MAYRITEKVQAALDERRASIIKATINAIKKDGIEIGIREVAARGKFSMGLIYKEFPDVTELKAAAFAQLLEIDLAEVRLAAAAEKNPLQELAAALAVLFTRWDNTRLVHAMMGSPIYRNGIRAELELLIGAALGLPPKARTAAAAGALGALYGLHDVSDGSRNRASAAVLFALKGMGVSDAMSRRAVAA